MDLQEATKEAIELKNKINYHNKKYYVEDSPEIDDYEYDMLYRRLQELEAQFPQLVTADSPTQKVGGAALNKFEPVVHEVPLESLHDSFSEQELVDFDRKVRAVVEHPVYIVEPKFDGKLIFANNIALTKCNEKSRLNMSNCILFTVKSA
jgi:DNA ligase (NAD+)